MACAQTHQSSIDPRWSLNARDSTVHGPYADFRLMYAKRVTADDQVRRAGRSISLLDSRVQTLEQQLAVSDEKAAGYKRGEQDANERAQLYQEQLIACGEKKASLRAFATVGKVTVYGGVAIAALYGANQLFHFIP